MVTILTTVLCLLLWATISLQDMPLGVDSSLKAQVCDSNVINDEKIQKMIACDQNWTKQQKPILTDVYVLDKLYL